MKYNQNSNFQVSENIVFRKQGDGNYLLLEIEGDCIFHLNDVAASIWELISQHESYQSIILKIQSEYDEINEGQIKEIDEFIEDLISKKIILVG